MDWKYSCLPELFLKEPLFMRHYYDMKNVGHTHIHYVQNKSDNLNVINLSFPELGDFPIPESWGTLLFIVLAANFIAALLFTALVHTARSTLAGENV